MDASVSLRKNNTANRRNFEHEPPTSDESEPLALRRKRAQLKPAQIVPKTGRRAKVIAREIEEPWGYEPATATPARRLRIGRPAKKRAIPVEDEEEKLQPKPQPSKRRATSTLADNSACNPEADVGSKEEINLNHDISMDELFPWVNQTSNILTQLVQTKLMERYRAEREIWSIEMHQEFQSVAPGMDFSIRPSTSSISNHKICKDAHKVGATWIDFWVLRVMFGPCACAKQSWFAELAEKHPWMLDEAAAGVVPSSIENMIEMGESDWFFRRPSKEMPEIMAPIPKPKIVDAPAQPVDEQTQTTSSNGAASHENIGHNYPLPPYPLSSLFLNDDILPYHAFRHRMGLPSIYDYPYPRNVQ